MNHHSVQALKARGLREGNSTAPSPSHRQVHGGRSAPGHSAILNFLEGYSYHSADIGALLMTISDHPSSVPEEHRGVGHDYKLPNPQSSAVS